MEWRGAARSGNARAPRKRPHRNRRPASRPQFDNLSRSQQAAWRGNNCGRRKGRETVYSLLPENLPWLAPVGRLDKASEGLLLLTNDSEWAAHVTAPETHFDKTYHVQINSIADEALLEHCEMESPQATVNSCA